jgi:L,D-transpeptidase ErfK/SrfK
MYPEDIAWLFEALPTGTPVTVVDQLVKVGWSGGELFLEVHPSQADADAIEAEGHSGRAGSEDPDELVAKAAGAQVGRVDWYRVHLAAAQRSGMVVQITRTPPLLARPGAPRSLKP